MTSYFLPRDRTFWLYHCSVLLLTCVIQGFSIWAWRDQQLFNLVGSLLWLVLYTLGVLTFRFHYRRYNWQRLNMARLIVLVLIYGLGVALFVTLAMLGLTLPLFWEQLFSPEMLEKHNTSIQEQLSMLLIGNVFSTHLFVSAWAFIYISVTTGRRVREAELTNLKLENSLKEARLMGLTSQLNPHFLFNSLNNIRFMIHENPVHADKTITALSEILRYSLESGRKDKVPLDQELEIVRRYLDVVALQLENRLQFQLTIPEALNRCLIPPMTLQMLMENAIKHGAENRKAVSELRLEGEDLGDSLRLMLRNPVPSRACDSHRNTGTGLANIEQRLRLLYGDKAQMSIRQDSEHFTVVLDLPKETAEQMPELEAKAETSK